jgi:hypothetical protein
MGKCSRIRSVFCPLRNSGKPCLLHKQRQILLVVTRMLLIRQHYSRPCTASRSGMRKIRAHLLETKEEQWQEEVIRGPTSTSIVPSERATGSS